MNPKILNTAYLKTIREKIEERRMLLIEWSYDQTFGMSSVERARIQSMLERGESPARPENITKLMRQFLTSAFSYSVLRKYLASLIDDIPMRDTIHLALCKAFNCNAFMVESNWTPEGLYGIALSIQEKQNYDLSSKQFNPRMISVLLTGSEKLSLELQNGLERYFQQISSVIDPSAM
jgi:hypothetical protein